jgi:hypothetical protein
MDFLIAWSYSRPAQLTWLCDTDDQANLGVYTRGSFDVSKLPSGEELVLHDTCAHQL